MAVVAAVAAVFTGISAASPPLPPTVEVVRAAVRIDGGATLSAEQLVVARLPVTAVPEDALADLESAVGRQVSAPVSQGQVLTVLSVAPAGRGARPGRVVAPLRLADADVAALLRVGDSVDVVAADGEAAAAAVVAPKVRVVGLPQPAETQGIGGTVSSSAGALVLVEVDTATAARLAQAAVTATLSVVLR